MNSEYKHTGKHLNKPIIRDLIPLVYPGAGHFTIRQFRGMIEKYHMENGGESWKVKGKNNLIRYVLIEYVEQHGWECKNEKTPFSYGLPKKSPEPITPKDYPGTLTLGSGTGSVYLYYYPRDNKLAESERKTVWECKIGMTESGVDTRVKAQRTTAIYEDPKIGLEIRTDNPRCLEKAIHAILELKGRKIETSGKANEWFLTSPTEVAGIYTILNSIWKMI